MFCQGRSSINTCLNLIELLKHCSHRGCRGFRISFDVSPGHRVGRSYHELNLSQRWLISSPFCQQKGEQCQNLLHSPTKARRQEVPDFADEPQLLLYSCTNRHQENEENAKQDEKPNFLILRRFDKRRLRRGIQQKGRRR